MGFRVRRIGSSGNLVRHVGREFVRECGFKAGISKELSMEFNKEISNEFSGGCSR